MTVTAPRSRSLTAILVVTMLLGTITSVTRLMVLLTPMLPIALVEGLVIGLLPIVLCVRVFKGTGLKALRTWYVVGIVDAALWLLLAFFLFLAGGGALSGMGDFAGHAEPAGVVIGLLFMSMSTFRAVWSVMKIVVFTAFRRRLTRLLDAGAPGAGAAH